MFILFVLFLLQFYMNVSEYARRYFCMTFVAVCKCVYSSPSAFLNATCAVLMSISASTMAVFADIHAVCACITSVTVITPSLNPRLATRRFSSAEAIFLLAVARRLLAFLRRKRVCSTSNLILFRTSFSSICAIWVAVRAALTLYLPSPQFQIGTCKTSPMLQTSLNFCSKPLKELGFVMV